MEDIPLVVLLASKHG